MPGASKYLTANELVELLDHSVSTKTLANWRCDAREPGPRFLRFGNRIRYPRSEAERWIEGRLHGSTIEYAASRDDDRSARAKEVEERAALEAKREALRQELAVLERQLDETSGATPTPRSGRGRPPTDKRGK